MTRRRQANATLVGFLAAHVAYEGTECLTWPYGRCGRGYGVLTFRGRHTGAHRAMCMLAHGNPPHAQAMATHSCGRGHEGCVNPRHIGWSDALGNSHDKYRDGTMVCGERQWKAKFSVDEIRRVRADTRPPTVVAAEFGVTASTISAIRHRRTWKFVPAADRANA